MRFRPWEKRGYGYGVDHLQVEYSFIKASGLQENKRKTCFFCCLILAGFQSSDSGVGMNGTVLNTHVSILDVIDSFEYLVWGGGQEDLNHSFWIFLV